MGLDAERVPFCVFDAYGTLLDVNSAVSEANSVLGETRAMELATLWRRKQLEYTWLRSLMRRPESFANVTADALRYGLAALGITDHALEQRLLAAYGRLSAYVEAAASLRALRERGATTAILSNGDPAMLGEGLARAGLGDLVDLVLSVVEVGVFKPSPEVYRLATERLGCSARQILFVSSNSWDVHGAASFGCRAVWVNRMGLPDDRLPGTPFAVLSDLSALPELICSGAAVLERREA